MSFSARLRLRLPTHWDRDRGDRHDQRHIGPGCPEPGRERQEPLATEREPPSSGPGALVAPACPVTGLHLFNAGKRGVYPCADALTPMRPAWRSLSVDVDEWGELHVARLRGELDFASVATLHERLGSVHCSTLQIDLTNLSFCDATGLSALVTAKRQRQLDGCKVTIVGASGIVRRVFEVTGLADVLDD